MFTIDIHLERHGLKTPLHAAYFHKKNIGTLVAIEYIEDYINPLKALILCNEPCIIYESNGPNTVIQYNNDTLTFIYQRDEYYPHEEPISIYLTDADTEVLHHMLLHTVFSNTLI